MSLGAPKASEEKSNGLPRTAETPWLREGLRASIPKGKFPLFFPLTFSTPLPFLLPSPTFNLIMDRAAALQCNGKIPRPALQKLLKSLCTDRTMISAYRCEEKRAHHISYLTQMDVRWKGRQFSRLPQVSFGVWVYDFPQPEAYVDNKIATTKMAGYYLLVYKNSPKECSSCFLWKFLCPDSSEAQGTQFLAWMIGSLLQNLNLLKAHFIGHLLYMQAWSFFFFFKALGSY